MTKDEEKKIVEDLLDEIKTDLENGPIDANDPRIKKVINLDIDAWEAFVDKYCVEQDHLTYKLTKRN